MCFFTRGLSYSSLLCCALSLTGQLVHSLSELNRLGNPASGGVSVVLGDRSGLVGFAGGRVDLVDTHESVDEVVHQVNALQNGLGAFHDLTVQRGLDVVFDIVDEILFDVVLKFVGFEGRDGLLRQVGVGDHHGEDSGHVGHDALQQGQRHCQEEGPRTRLVLGESGGVRGVDLPADLLDHLKV